MAGSYLLNLAAVAAVFSLVGYFQVARGKQSYLLAAKWSYWSMTFFTFVAVLFMVFLLANSRFEYAYVSSYTSLDLPINFKITALWAGQEGSFLLWLALTAVLGLWVGKKAHDQLGWVMTFFLLGQFFLLVLLLISSPFRMNPGTPIDGRGLNPLLQNFWMQIHPPIVFLGFATTFVPFAFAMAALITKRFDSWTKLVFPWVILSICTLGAGTFLGGYWAYETLGWGGYWGWDPVENAVLVPWIASIALAHGIILERKRQIFSRANLFMAITLFLLTLYGTFLTRSGVLADFSVHSFVDLGYTAYLVIFILLFAVLGYGLLAYRWKEIPSSSSAQKTSGKEFVVFLGILFILLSGILVLLGMSAPLLTRLWKEPSAVTAGYYVMTNLPIGIIVSLLMGLAPVMAWHNNGWVHHRSRLAASVAISTVIALAGVFLGVRGFAHIAFLLAAAFAMVANLLLVVTKLRNRAWSFQADLIHAGIGMMFIGVIASSAYSPHQKLTLALSETKQVFGHDIRFEKLHQPSPLKLTTDLVVSKGKAIFAASPLFMESPQGLMRHPAIKKFLFYDLYISPEEYDDSYGIDATATYLLQKGQPRQIDDLTITFNAFDVGSHMGQAGEMSIGAELAVTCSQATYNIKPLYVVGADGNPQVVPASIPDLGKSVYLLKINADQGQILIGVSGNDSSGGFVGQPAVSLEVSIKPLINLVWFGLLLVVVGSGWSFLRRAKEVR